MNVLALDLGKKRTGVAFYDDATGIPLPLDALVTENEEDLLQCVRALARERHIEHLVIGLPLLPSGLEGAQARWVRSVSERLKGGDFRIHLLDERYTTPRSKVTDKDASAAVFLLQSAVQRGISKI